jgi:hypothetical protein
MKTKISNFRCSINRAVGLMPTLFLGGILCAQAQYTYTNLSVPGYGDTYAEGTSGNNIVGSYFDGGYTVGFLVTPVPEPSALGLWGIVAAAFVVRQIEPRSD